MADPTLSWRHAALVFAGGAAGTALRALALAPEGATAEPVVVAVINVVGAFALGLLNGALARRAETARVRRVRLLVGTGLLGGFTTYSTFAVLAAHHLTIGGIALTLGTVITGTLAAWAALRLGRGRAA